MTARTRLLLALLVAVAGLAGTTAARGDVHLSRRSSPLAERPVTKASSGSSLTVPYFEVDLGDPGGKTLLFAVHNPSSLPADVDVSYSRTDGVIVGGQSYLLGGNAVLTVNLRDVPGQLPTVNTVGVSRGFVGIVATDPGDPGIDRQIAVDYFEVTPDEDFATGERASPYHEMVAGPDGPFLCTRWSARYIEGGPFTGGTRLVLFVDTPLGTSTPSISIDVYSESGTFLGGTDISTTQVTSETSVGSILSMAGVTGEPFGVLLVDFAAGTNGGHVTAKYRAFGEFSVGLTGACIF